jgi:signal transduction histidine kinase
VTKHANAKRASVKVAARDGRVSIEVADDGGGFDVSAVKAGFGVTGMRERIALAGGTIEIASGGRGTTVRATLPARYISPAEPSGARR